MMRRTLLITILAATAVSMAAQEGPVPEKCLAGPDAKAKVSVTHGGKTYRLANDACGAQFLADPERYSQLYDALLELAAEGAPLVAPPASSLVPS